MDVDSTCVCRYCVDTRPHLHVHLATQLYLESFPFVEGGGGVRTDMYLHRWNCNKIFLDKCCLIFSGSAWFLFKLACILFKVLALDESEKVNLDILSFPAYKKRSIVCVFAQHREADR